jgi:uncharacterized protein
MSLVRLETLERAGIPKSALAMLQSTTDRHPCRLIFASISGAHLYGFPSPDSDFDLRGTHVISFEDYCRVDKGQETIETLGDQAGYELDLVTHDIRKFLNLLLKPNGYVLEQLLSPLVLRSSTMHEELVDLAPRLLTRDHAKHYLGFARAQRKLFHKGQQRKIKPLLYLYRVLLTGIHLMESGRIQANLGHLLEDHHQPGVQDLVRQKLNGTEHGALDSGDVQHHDIALDRLEQRLLQAQTASKLPRAPACRAELEDLHYRARIEGARSHP